MVGLQWHPYTVLYVRQDDWVDSLWTFDPSSFDYCFHVKSIEHSNGTGIGDGRSEGISGPRPDHLDDHRRPADSRSGGDRDYRPASRDSRIAHLAAVTIPTTRTESLAAAAVMVPTDYRPPNGSSRGAGSRKDDRSCYFKFKNATTAHQLLFTFVAFCLDFIFSQFDWRICSQENVAGGRRQKAQRARKLDFLIDCDAVENSKGKFPS